MKKKFGKYKVMSGCVKESCVTAFTAREALEKAIQHEGFTKYEIEPITASNEGENKPVAEVSALGSDKKTVSKFYINLDFKSKRKL